MGLACGDNMWVWRDEFSELERCIINLTTSYQLHVLHSARWKADDSDLLWKEEIDVGLEHLNGWLRKTVGSPVPE
jgi:hypothetical protein